MSKDLTDLLKKAKKLSAKAKPMPKIDKGLTKAQKDLKAVKKATTKEED